jgi:hypothetical protein
MTVNGAFEAPVPEPDGWLVLDADSNQVSLLVPASWPMPSPPWVWSMSSGSG